MPRTVLVTGAAGFIGFHTALRLLRRGDHVIGFDNLNDYYDVTLKEDRLRELEAHDAFTGVRADLVDAARPACSPPVQVAARHVEARVLTVLREAHISWFRDDRSRGFLEAPTPAWAAWQRDDVGARNAMVRGLVWSAEWERELGLTKLVLDEITVDAFIDDDPALAETLPARAE